METHPRILSASSHYDRHLGRVYGWMIGDFDVAVAACRAELEAAGVPPGAGARAVDLGAGNGASTIALADLGYDVVAVDTCAVLLDELRSHARGRSVTPVLGDAAGLPSVWPPPAMAITCMGDTLPHFESLEVAQRLLRAAAAALAPGGIFVATFRDYTGPPPQGAARFIPVRADDQRILTCVLDYRDDVVLVHDLLHERRDGRWETSVSAYPKLRLAPGAVRDVLARAGLDATVRPGARGMVRLSGHKRGPTDSPPARGDAAAPRPSDTPPS
jgi:SAM-dependent methyltransferase